MNTPANGPNRTRVIELPAPKPPVLTRMISDPLFNEQTEAITWVLGQANPLVGDMKIVRMFVDDTGVEVYSVPENPSRGYTRNLIPIAKVRLTEEAMPLEIFVEELADAEDDSGDDDDDDTDPEEETLEGSAAAVSDSSVPS